MDNFDYSIIGQRIKTLRKRKGLNQTQLANLIGKSLRTMQKYETGEIEVSIDVVMHWQNILILRRPLFLAMKPIRRRSEVLQT